MAEIFAKVDLQEHLVWIFCFSTIAVVIFYVNACVAIKKLVSFRLEPSLEVLNFEELKRTADPDAVDLLSQAARELNQLGFSVVGYLSRTDNYLTRTGDVIESVSFSVMAKNPAEEFKAIAAVVRRPIHIGAADSGGVLSDVHTTFSGEYEDGTKVITSNTVDDLTMAPAESTILQFPRVSDLSRLYRIHLSAIQEFADGKKKKGLPQYQLWIEKTLQVMKDEVRRRIELGYLTLDTAEAHYDPTRQKAYLTWKGARSTCWKIMWPTAQIRRRLRNRRMARLLAKLGRN